MKIECYRVIDIAQICPVVSVPGCTSQPKNTDPSPLYTPHIRRGPSEQLVKTHVLNHDEISVHLGGCYDILSVRIIDNSSDHHQVVMRIGDVEISVTFAH